VSLTLNGGRIIANPSLSRVHGFKVAGGYGLRLGLEFVVPAWQVERWGSMPTVIFFPATVQVGDSEPFALGHAFAENPQPFTVTEHGSGPTGVLFDLILSPAAVERLERTRDGRGMHFKVKLQAEARRPDGTLVIWEELSKTFSQSDWLLALEHAGYGRTMLFEVPIPESAQGNGHWSRLLERARREYIEGRYSTSVGTCRLVLESLTTDLKQDVAIQEATDLKKKRDRTVEQRELALRKAAMDYANAAHHVDSGHPDDLYDRREAQMLLGVTANLVATSLTRQADIQRAAANSS
jgi:hypothetical protein